MKAAAALAIACAVSGCAPATPLDVVAWRAEVSARINAIETRLEALEHADETDSDEEARGGEEI